MLWLACISVFDWSCFPNFPKLDWTEFTGHRGALAGGYVVLVAKGGWQRTAELHPCNRCTHHTDDFDHHGGHGAWCRTLAQDTLTGHRGGLAGGNVPLMARGGGKCTPQLPACASTPLQLHGGARLQLTTRHERDHRWHHLVLDLLPRSVDK